MRQSETQSQPDRFQTSRQRLIRSSSVPLKFRASADFGFALAAASICCCASSN